MIVSELIQLLQKFPQGLPVAYRCCSEQTMLEPEKIMIKDLCLPRPDGWIQNNRGDMPTQLYVLFPGN